MELLLVKKAQKGDTDAFVELMEMLINRPAPSILITVLRQVVFLIPFIFVLPILFDINGIFFAQPISDAITTILSMYLVLKERKEMLSLSQCL